MPVEEVIEDADLRPWEAVARRFKEPEFKRRNRLKKLSLFLRRALSGSKPAEESIEDAGLRPWEAQSLCSTLYPQF